MKIFVTTILLGWALTAPSCKKNESPSPVEGTWELRYIEGAWAPPTTLQAGNGILLRFAGRQFTAATPGQPDRHTTFRLERDAAYYTGRFRQYLFLEDDVTAPLAKTYLSINGDTLRMQTDSKEVTDAYSLRLYVRVP